MNNIKVSFSIKDLENLSGIKAHTIRIWEKRYELFEPSRTETNIRYYSLKSLQKKVLNTDLWRLFFSSDESFTIYLDKLIISERKVWWYGLIGKCLLFTQINKVCR